MLMQIIAVLMVLILLYFVVMGVTGNKLGFLFSGTPDSGSKAAGFNNVEQVFFTTVFSLLGYVARKDGPVNNKEIVRANTFMENMHLDTAQRHQAEQLFLQGASPNFKVEKALQNFQGLAQRRPNLTQILLVYLVSLARVDGLLVDEEIAAVREIAGALGYSQITFEHLLKMLSSQDRFREGSLRRATQDDVTQAASDSEGAENRRTRGFSNAAEQSQCAYDALGLTPDATANEVRSAYQKLASQLHPDKLIGQGLPPFMIQALTERFKDIQSAYDCINKEKRVDST